jgi:hypothetical protein
MKKCVRPRENKLVAACDPNDAQRTSNQSCIRSSKAYIQRSLGMYSLVNSVLNSIVLREGV